jgi:hypothetical protein
MKTTTPKNLIILAIFIICWFNSAKTYATSCVLVNATEGPVTATVGMFSGCDTVYVYGELIINGTIDLTGIGPITLIVDAGYRPVGDTAMLRFPNGPNHLRLATNSVLILANGGYLEGDPACSNADRIFIGSLSYARCSGGGNAEYLFSDLNTKGGSVRTRVEVSPNELCLGESFSMEAFVEGGFEDYRRTELWVTPPSGGARIIYGTEVAICDPENPELGVVPFNITFSYDTIENLEAFKYSEPGVYVFRARTTDRLCFWHEVIFTVIVHGLPVATFTGDLEECISTTLTPDVLADATVYFQGTNADGYSELVIGAVEITSSDTYYFRAKSDFGCWGPSVPAVVTIDNSEGGTTSVSEAIVCLGSDVVIELSGYTGSLVRWERGSARGDINWVEISFTGDILVDAPSSGSYFYRALVEGVICPEVYSDQITVSVNDPSDVIMEDGTGYCEVNSSEWIHIFNSDNKLIASINGNGQDLGDVTASLSYSGGNAFTVLATGSCTQQQAVLNRVFDINPISQPSSSVNVRLYFTQAELDGLIALAGCGDPNGCANNDDVCSLYDVRVTKISGTNRDILLPTYGSDFGVLYAEVEIDGFSEFWLHGSQHGVPLPVELLSFEATAVNNEYIKLNWSTATEINNDGFEIQRSLDGVNFTKIGWANGMGNTSNKQDYLFNDFEAVAGVNYYRLKQIDFNGDFEYSPIVSATLKAANGFEMAELRPNPAREAVWVDVNATQQMHANIVILNHMGQPAIKTQELLQKGFNTVKVDVSRLPAGAYLYSMENNEMVVTKKFVVFR